MNSSLSHSNIAKARRLVSNQVKLPVLPSIATMVMRELTRPETSAEQVADIIRQDAAIAAGVLKVANSIVYKRRVATSTLEAAIVRLGYQLVRDLVISLSTRSMFRTTDQADQQLWDHAIATALAAKVVAAETRRTDPNEAFVAGLLHDVGKIVLKNDNHDRFMGAAKRITTENMPSSAAERSAFSFHHGTVGGILLMEWNLPQEMANAIYWHHDLENPENIPAHSQNLTWVTSLANAIVNSLGINLGMKSIEPGAESQIACEALGVSERAMTKMTKKVESAYRAEHRDFA